MRRGDVRPRDVRRGDVRRDWAVHILDDFLAAEGASIVLEVERINIRDPRRDPEIHLVESLERVLDLIRRNALRSQA